MAYAENFHGGGLGKDHMVVICIWFALLVTSQFDVISGGSGGSVLTVVLARSTLPE